NGIRDPLVTGVQTCALPISNARLHEIKHAQPPSARRRLKRLARKRTRCDPVEWCRNAAVPGTVRIEFATLSTKRRDGYPLDRGCTKKILGRSPARRRTAAVRRR